MSGTNYFRLIEAYFDGTISTYDKVLLENQLVKDPLLRAEFDLQKNISEGIKNFRKEQLKTRLNAVEVPQPTNFIQFNSVKWLGSTLILASLVGVGLYYLSGTSNTIIPLDISDKNTLVLEHSENSLTSNIPHVAEKVSSKDSNLNSSEKAEYVATTAILLANNKNIIDEETKANNPIATVNAKINPQALLSYEDESLFNTDQNVIVKQAPMKTDSKKVEHTKIELNKPVAEEQYHYKYFDNKLYLYGDFSKEPYELIELNSKGEKQLYLSYNNRIYPILNSKKEITQMIAIKNKQLKEEINLLLQSN